jgi:eukaryotic-like serine/threonine-protein kinase
MTPERWQHVDELFHSALACEPALRAAFLARACSDDEPLLREVESLISFHEDQTSFIETPASDIAAGLLAKKPNQVEAGQQVSHYKVVSSLGVGGMGEVYLAEDQRLGRRIALKLLPAQFTTDAERVRRFEQEARAASALNHPNIVTIYEIGRVDSTHFIATEFIDGETLREYVAGRTMKLNEVLDIGIQIASALAAAHADGIVHRDIKPENVMLRRDGIVKVLDFGLAKLASQQVPAVDPEGQTRSMVETNPGVLMGTVRYMSPEQARGQEVDAGTDIWSLGVVLYEMVTGRAPFEGETPSHVIVSILERELSPLASCSEVPVELERIVSKALRKERPERYQTASDLALDLKSLKQELEVESRLDRNHQRTDKNNARMTAPSDSDLSVKTIDESAATTVEVVRTSSGSQDVMSQLKRQKRVAVLAAVAILVAVASTAYFFYTTRSGEAINSVAVLPFENVSGEPGTESLSDGISDSIINSLSQLPNLRVIALNTVLRYKGKKVDPQAVGHELNVKAVLMGRLTQQGDLLAISAELVDVRDNGRLWGAQYDRKLSDILVVQGEIAQQISDGLRLRLSGEEKKQLARQYTENPEAYLLYSSGNYYFRQRTKQAAEKAIESFNEAIRIDPNYALAYTGLAHTYQFMGTRGFAPPKESQQKVEEAALAALKLDDTLAEGHAFLGVHRFVNFDWAGAEKEIRRALDLDPNSAFANTAYASYLTGIGRADEGLKYRIRANELDSTPRPGELAFGYFLARQYDDAIAMYRKDLEKRPDNAHAHIQLGEAYVAKGMLEEGVGETQAGINLDATLDKTPERWDRYPMLAYAYAAAGRRDEALKVLGEQQRLAKQRYVSPYNFTIIYTGLGDKDEAFAWLAKAIEERSQLLSHLKSRPMFDPLRSDPRYAELLRKMNLAP